MCNPIKRPSARWALLALVLIVVPPSLVAAKPPEGWVAAGMAPRDYDMGVDRNVSFDGKPTVLIRASKLKPSGFGTLMQMFKADDYRGKRVRFAAQVKSEAVTDWAGLWMRVDGPENRETPSAFDNMQDRPIKGTTGWTPYQLVLDVASDAKAIAFGVLLDGSGAVWMGAVKLEVVDRSVPVTGRSHRYNDKPRNLDFVE